ncbi:uncharacterized protein EAE97_011087 [Botrytis byssoidea]|uniref:2EXR domain-containing protein n=1 Tax=Botrytis byssoidea TaxID=139641 RepID=A0A9P5HZE3_9HELO|nr:uncharacterized protein EAE97_011087 [Botrytis byssoidea]KAF7922345.1 hypothetical protein EAE97_011087 [Botrytis byssoidea]
MSFNKHLSNPSRPAPRGAGQTNGSGGQGGPSTGSAPTEGQSQIQSTNLATATNNGGLSQNTEAPVPVAAPRGKGKGKKNKWAKVNLNDIAPMAGPSISAQPSIKGRGPNKKEQSFGLLVEDNVETSRRHEGPHRGVNIDGESLGEIADCLKKLDLEKASKPLTEFTIFSKLTPELRYKIWNIAARSSPRILEVVLHPDFPCPPNGEPDYIDSSDPNDLRNHNHGTWHVSKPGQKVPAILQATQESRAEAQRVYEKRYLNNFPANYPYRQNEERPWTYYNPYVDVLFFGDGVCILTLVNFFRCHSEEIFPRLAFRCVNFIGTCKYKCTYDTWEWPQGEDEYACICGAGIGGGGIDVMGILHGKDMTIARNSLVPGVPSVEEVFFVVKTECMKFPAGQMPSTLTFRPAIHNGLTQSQQQKRTDFEAEVVKARAGEGVRACGANRWNDKLPDFSFVSLAPSLKDGKGKILQHDAVQVPTEHMGKLTYRSNEFLNELAVKANLEIVPAPKAYVGEKNREIGLYNGTEKGIELAKEEIQKQLLKDFNANRRGPNHQGGNENRGGSCGRGGYGGRRGRGQ